VNDDGVALTSMTHPVAEVRGPLPAQMLSPSSLETIEIELEPRAVLPLGSIKYDPLPTSCDLCGPAIEWALERLGWPQIDSTLYVSPKLSASGISHDWIDDLPASWLVSRVRVEPSLRPHEWFIETGDGRMIGSAPPE
jgi:hypothetical protein